MFLNREFLDFIDSCKKESLDVVVASVVETLGSTYAKSGNMILVDSKYRFVGVLGSPYLHERILKEAKKAFEKRETIVFDSIPKDESSGHGESKFFVQAFFHKESYGALGVALDSFGKSLVRDIKDGSFSILDKECETKLEGDKFYQTIKRAYSILIFGSGAHVSSLVSMVNLMGWRSTVVDLRVKEQYIKEADEVIELERLKDILSMDLSTFNASVILSHSPKTDDVYLKALLSSKIGYIGMMGNKKNMRRITKEFSLENDKRFFAPIGLDIGGNTHQSIALSICAQIEAFKNRRV